MTGHSLVLISSFVFARHVFPPVDTAVVVDVWPVEEAVVLVVVAMIVVVVSSGAAVEVEVA